MSESNEDGFERKQLNNGTPNPKYVDVLDEDQSIAGQKFTTMSFLSPDKILEKRELYLFDQFIQQWDFSKSMSKFGDFINFISYKYNLNVENIMSDYNDFCKEEQNTLRQGAVTDDFQNFLDKNEDRLTEQFQREHAFQTSVRGVKTRGNFATQGEAEQHCKKLREKDPNHDIFVAPVGVWLPWDPNAYKTGRVEFMEEELNNLHQEKIKNEAKAKDEFDKRVKDTKQKAIEENIIKAEKSGNALTQTMNENGDLIGVKETINFEDRDVANDEDRKKHEEQLLARQESRNASAADISNEFIDSKKETEE
jgi:hypothetical protein